MGRRTTGGLPLRVSETRGVILEQILGLIKRFGKGAFRETERRVQLRTALCKEANGEPLSEEEKTILLWWSECAPDETI